MPNYRIPPRTFLFAALVSSLPALAQPIITDEFAFTERRGATSLFASSHTFLVGANITPSGSGTTAFASHVPGGSGPDYPVPFTPSPLNPTEYSIRIPYAGQTGQWQIGATDSGGTTTRLTHVLDDVRDLPLITGLTASGPALTPHLTWNAVDAALFPSFCGGIFGACTLGYDFFGYRIEVREIVGTPGNLTRPLVYTSPSMATSLPGTFTPTQTAFDIPSGVLSYGNDYLIGIRLTHNELEAFLPNNRFFSPLENRSTAFVEVSPIPEPETYAMLLAGLGLLGFEARRRRKPKHAPARNSPPSR